MKQDTRRLEIWADTPAAARQTGARSVYELQARAQAIRALTEGRSVVYALRLADGTVKIGNTHHLDSRRRHYPGAEVIGFQYGTREDEQALHAELVAHRARGREYYHPTPEVLAIVNDMRDDFGLPHIAA